MIASLFRERILLPPECDAGLVNALAGSLNIPERIAAVLCARGLTNAADVRAFFNPSITQLHSPFLFRDMEKAVEKIVSVLKARGRICVYGDYDVDGITAIALLFRFLGGLSADVFYHVPNRLNEGYGLSAQGVRQVAGLGAKLVITVDCGITAEKEIRLANELGMDVIVTDHHTPRNTLPPAFAVINPKLRDGAYPDSELSGVGVAFKLAQAVFERLHPGKNSLSDDGMLKYLDLVSIGTAADIVPLTGENRILVRNGFPFLKKSACEGIKALLHVTGLYEKEIGTGQVVFQIAPLINAAGRLGDPRQGVEFFVTENPDRAKSLSENLRQNNLERKNIDLKITEECFAVIDKTVDLQKTYFLVMAAEHWHPGVLGIVASRVVERYCRPTLILSIENGCAKGSARSIQTFRILEAIESCGDLLEESGGHQFAAAVTVRRENIEALRVRLNDFALGRLSEKQLRPDVRTDAEIHDLDVVDWDFLGHLRHFEPFGPGNMRPVFFARDLSVVGQPRIVGSNHLRFKVRSHRVCFDAVAFRMGDRLLDISRPGARVTLAFTVEENEWMDQKTIQFNIRGIA
jgi:single-stranded-DNA-specific exonuclease